MADDLNSVVLGRSTGKDGHGEHPWEDSCELLVTGRREGTLGRAFAPRPNLGRDLVKALQKIAGEKKWEQVSFRACLSDMIELFVCFDDLEANSSFYFDGGAEDVAGQPWLLFTNWLDARREGKARSRIYWQCKRVIEAAVARKFGQLPPGFIIPPNPFRQREQSGNWDRTDDLEDEEYKRIGQALILQLEEASSRLESGRHLLPRACESGAKLHDPAAIADAGRGSRTKEDQEAERLVRSLWHELVHKRLLPKTAVILGSEVRTFDSYPDATSDEAVGVSSDRPGWAVSRVALELRIKILLAVQRGSITYNALGAELIGIDYHQLRGQGAKLIASGMIGLSRVSRKQLFLLKTALTDQAVERHLADRDLMDAPRLGMTEQLRILIRALPTQQELRCAFALLLLRTGWNVSTVLNMKVDDWHRVHPIHGIAGTYVDLISRKGRSHGRLQFAQSSTNKPFSAYDVVRRVLEWTEPLRDLLDLQIDVLTTTARGGSAQSRMECLREIGRLKQYRNRLWLSLLADGRVGEPEIRWTDLNSAMADLGVTRSDGSPITFTQKMTRRAWTIFNYDRSGANLILTKIALGHSDFDSLMAYIASQKLLNQQRRKWVSLQKALLQRFRVGGSTGPEVIRALVDEGRLSVEEASRAASDGSLTSKGMRCANPTHPDVHVDPRHKPGRTCGTQNCMDGCSKSFVTFDTAVHLARQIAKLEELRGNMSVLAWNGSDHPEQLEAAEELFKEFTPANQELARKEIRRRRPRAFFGQPSLGARLAAGIGATPS